MVTYEKGVSLISIRVGDRVRYRDGGREGVVVDIALTPNGVDSPELVAVLMARVESRTTPDAYSYVTATVDNFEPAVGATYSEFYPSLFGPGDDPEREPLSTITPRPEFVPRGE